MASHVTRSKRENRKNKRIVSHREELAAKRDRADSLHALGLQPVEGVVGMWVDDKLRGALSGLGQACLLGTGAAVALLVQCGQDINNGGEYGATGLHCACAGGHVELAQWLVSQGAHVNLTDA